MPGPSATSVISLQSHLQKSFRQWVKYYKNNGYHSKALDPVEHELLFFASFTNVFSDSLKEEIHLAANLIFKKDKPVNSWVPFCNHIFIMVLDWSVNGINFKKPGGERERKIFYRFIAMTYSYNPSIKRYGQQLLFCMMTKSNWQNPELLQGVVYSCKQNIASTLFSIDYVIAVLSFLDLTKAARGAYFIICIKTSFKDLTEFHKHYTGLNILSYKCVNPFYEFYSSLLLAGRKAHRDVCVRADNGKIGAQLKFDTPTAGLEFKFLNETVRIQKQIGFLNYFLSEAHIQKMFNSKKPQPVLVGEAYSYTEPPSSSEDFRG